VACATGKGDCNVASGYLSELGVSAADFVRLLASPATYPTTDRPALTQLLVFHLWTVVQSQDWCTFFPPDSLVHRNKKAAMVESMLHITDVTPVCPCVMNAGRNSPVANVMKRVERLEQRIKAQRKRQRTWNTPENMHNRFTAHCPAEYDWLAVTFGNPCEPSQMFFLDNCCSGLCQPALPAPDTPHMPPDDEDMPPEVSSRWGHAASR